MTDTTTKAQAKTVADLEVGDDAWVRERGDIVPATIIRVTPTQIIVRALTPSAFNARFLRRNGCEINGSRVDKRVVLTKDQADSLRETLVQSARKAEAARDARNQESAAWLAERGVTLAPSMIVHASDIRLRIAPLCEAATTSSTGG